jgi:hypothetical protein
VSITTDPRFQALIPALRKGLQSYYTLHFLYTADSEDKSRLEPLTIKLMHPVKQQEPVTAVVFTIAPGAQRGHDTVELTLTIDGEVFMSPVGYLTPAFCKRFLDLDIEAQKHMIGELLNGNTDHPTDYHG